MYGTSFVFWQEKVTKEWWQR